MELCEAHSILSFWPALFALEADGVTAQEAARLRGEMEAIRAVSVQKNGAISRALVQVSERRPDPS